MKKLFVYTSIILLCIAACRPSSERERQIMAFNEGWRFHLGDIPLAEGTTFDDSGWRELTIPHDWSIEGEFNEQHPATAGGGALPGGIGWYRKSFTLPEEEKGKLVFIDFDGVYRNSEVWINGHYLGKRPNGYISFRYDLTPYVTFGAEQNSIAVKVDNSQQPNSRWYSGSGIYRNVWLTLANPIHIDHWGTFITTSSVSQEKTDVSVLVTIKNSTDKNADVVVRTDIYDPSGKRVATSSSDEVTLSASEKIEIEQHIQLTDPALWSVDQPQRYTANTIIQHEGKVIDDYETPFGIRSISFDSKKGFFLNGEPMKIKGVCNHHDLGCLGAAVNTRALERQLEILKEMGVNSIRTAHNPPTPELLDLCDKMGFLVMDEMFDMWKKSKSPYDYSMYWDEWHAQDLKDFIRRDRNHPSIIIWSIGNEILEQWDSTGTTIANELAGIVRSLDTTRFITAACNDPQPHNNIIKSGALDLIGYNYKHELYEKFPTDFPGQKFIATETTSALATRGHYDMPSDTIKRWPIRWDIPFTEGNPDNTVSAYDHVSAPWGSTHEETWKVVRKHDYLSGMYIWTGFDYLGEPTPYGWPSRSSYFGVIDLAGFPKDSYYMYKSEWTDEPVLHVFPHWNWTEGDSIDVWAYTNADEVELFLNDKTLGTLQKNDEYLHLMWRVAFAPGTLRAVARKNGKEFLVKEVKTAGKPARIEATTDRQTIQANGRDLSFITIKIVDEHGVVVPYADTQVTFTIEGSGFIAGVDNGDPVSHESFKANTRKAFHGLCLAVIQNNGQPGKIKLLASAEGLEDSVIELNCQ